MKGTEAVEMALHTQAGQWLVRLQEPDCTEQERAQCEHWRAQSPVHENAFRMAERIWQRSAGLGQDPAIAQVLRQAAQRRTPRTTRRRLLWLLPVAASAAAVVLLIKSPLWAPADPSVPYRTALGEQRRIDLPDGTAVLLDTGTALVAHYSRGQRFIELEAGQARFDVHPDPKRPFVVRAQGGMVTALGTQFQVRLDSGTTTVTLLEGRVSVRPPPTHARRQPTATLSPGQQLRFDQDGHEWATMQADLDSANAWTEGHVFAEQWRLDRLVTEMNRYSATKLRLSDPSLAELRISGGFRAGDQQALVLVLEHSLPVQSERTGSDIVLSPKQ